MSNLTVTKIKCEYCNFHEVTHKHDVNDSMLCEKCLIDLKIDCITENNYVANYKWENIKVAIKEELEPVKCENCSESHELYNCNGDLLCEDCSIECAYNYLDDNYDFNSAWYEYKLHNFNPFENISNIDKIKDEFTQEYFINYYLDPLK